MVVDEDILVDYLNSVEVKGMTKITRFISVGNIVLYEYSKLITFKFHALDKDCRTIFSEGGAVSMYDYEDYLFYIIRKDKIEKIIQNMYDK